MKMSHGLKLRHALILASFAAVLAFQNCAQPVEQSSESSASTGYGDGLPQAYKAKIDTLSYMSCSGMNGQPVEKRAYYTFRASAYSSVTGGLSLNPDFVSRTSYYTLANRARALADSEINGNTLLSLSVRDATNLQVPWKEGDLHPQEELDSFLPALSYARIAGPMAASAGRQINYFPGDFSKRLMEASLRFYNFDNTATATRNVIQSGQALLVMGYAGSTDESDTSLRGPAGSTSASGIYGTGYKLSFDLPASSGTGEPRVLSSSNGVIERDLLTGTENPTSWACDPSFRFVVVRPEDIAASRVVCATSVDRYANATQQAALAAIRRVLRVEDWFVDMDRKCIVPKRTGDYCYGPLNGRTIQYGQLNCANTSTTTCPHFVSVCIRN